MDNKRKIIELNQRRWELERELSDVKLRLGRIATAVDRKGVTRIHHGTVELDVVSRYYAKFGGKGSAAEALEKGGLHEYVYKGHDSQALGRYLRVVRHLQDGETYGDFVLRRVSWFQRKAT